MVEIWWWRMEKRRNIGLDHTSYPRAVIGPPHQIFLSRLISILGVLCGRPNLISIQTLLHIHLLRATQQNRTTHSPVGQMAMALQSASASAAMVAAAAPPPTVAAAPANSVSSSPSAVSFAPWKSSSFLGQRLHSAPAALQSPHKAAGAALVMAASSSSPATETEKEAPVGFTPPELKPDTPSPIFGGSTGGLLRKAQVEEFYVITWESPKEQIFEMPTGGAAIMREGPNLLKLARKEQCLALGTRLRSKYKIKYQFYRVFPNGEVQYLHPKDGVYPEKVNPGRKGVGVNFRSIGKNVNPSQVKFTGKQTYDV